VPKDILRIRGVEAVQAYLLAEVQKVYRSQNVTINDKHIEIIVSQMLRNVKVKDPGDTDLLPDTVIDKFRFRAINEEIVTQGKKPATADPLLQGITKASVQSESFISAASFQETTKVLTEAALSGKRDDLVGLKENVIMGHMIPAGTGFREYFEKGVKKLGVPSGAELEPAPVAMAAPAGGQTGDLKELLFGGGFGIEGEDEGDLGVLGEEDAGEDSLGEDLVGEDGLPGDDEPSAEESEDAATGDDGDGDLGETGDDED
jgi:hypothetical protein